MRVVIFIVAILSFISMIDARHNMALPRNYMRNINNAIVNYCNIKAHSQIQDDEIYTCFKNKMTNCNTYANFSKFDAIRSECMTNKGSDCGYGIIIGIMIWVVIAICTNTPH